jgi:hypothetical protein
MADQRTADILQWAALLLPHTGDATTGAWDLDAAIRWAERLDARLAERGYGAAGASGPPPAAEPGPPEAAPRRGRPRKDPSGDFYGALNPRLRTSFDTLWTAYGLAKGKQEAARAWALLCPDEDLAGRIVVAARADAQGAAADGATRADGTARKWLQGWLGGRRWEDGPALASAQALVRREPVAVESATLRAARALEGLK